MKILLADDDRTTLLTLSKILEKDGHEVVTCTDGQQALGQFRKPDSPDVAILDWMMPGRTGLEVLNWLNGRGLRVRKYLIMLSARNRQSDITEALRSGADDYLCKPVNPNDLLARLIVAERTVRHYQELRDYAIELETLARRNNFLSQIAIERVQKMALMKQTVESLTAVPFGSPGGAADAAATLVQHQPVFHQEHNTLPDELLDKAAILNLRKLVATALDGLAIEGEAAPTQEAEKLLASGGEAWHVWAPVVDIAGGWWIELLASFPPAAMKRLGVLLYGEERPGAEQLGDIAGEFMNLLQHQLSAHLQGREEEAALTPYTPRTARMELGGELDEMTKQFARWRIVEGPACLRLRLLVRPLAVVEKEPEHLRVDDLLAEDVASPEDAGMVLLKAHTALGRRHIEAIDNWASSGMIEPPVRVFPGSLLGAQLASV